jgi:aspartyl-tRNA synthetase
MMDWTKRVYCGNLKPEDTGQSVLLLGWVDAIRHHGNVLFIHLRDMSGIVQVVFNIQENPEFFHLATTLREEFVVEISGQVALRLKGTENPNLSTGQIEIIATHLNVLSRSKALPFQISEKAMVFGEELKANPAHVDEDLRLQYRYLDLRRPSMQEHFIKRYEIIKCIRKFLDQKHFIEVETPVLTKSTPEGARDYLVPSRIHAGAFYALPQSPQLFKQILMMSGLDRYFQIVKCFRDEDLRPNRQPEFTQLDLEASFINEEFIYKLLEELTAEMFRTGGIELDRPFPRMSYDDALNQYGSDRPDLRFDMAFENVTDILKNTHYSIFQRIIKAGGFVKGFCVKGHAESLSKNVLQNEYSLKIAPSFGAKGMTWMKVVNGQLDSNIVQFFNENELSNLRKRFDAEEGDVLILIADKSLDLINRVLGSLRLHLANRLKIIPAKRFCPLWVTDFPLFESDGTKLNAVHHPFTMPHRVDFDIHNREELLTLKARAYDLVMNGEELGGGSIRIHRVDIQRKVFQALGLHHDEIENKFGFFLKALEFGAPPHGGLALGLDRVVAMILQLDSIREVIAFPKNRSAFCPLTQAPSLVQPSQLQELGLDMHLKVEITPGELPETLSIEKTTEPSHATKSPEKISRDQVRYIARLARLKIDEIEIEQYQKDLNSILDYMSMLNELNTENILPMHHVLDVKNCWREDVPANSKSPQKILANAPSKEGDYFKVPQILEG